MISKNKRTIPWIIEEQTKIKHELLKKYISPWMSILFRAQDKLKIKNTLIYIDGFSGPGIYYSDSKKQNVCDGSPLIVAKKVNEYIEKKESRKVLIYCIDENQECTDILKRELDKINKYRQDWKVYNGEFSNKILYVLKDIETKKLTGFPKFIFIDPFGYSGYPISLLQQLLSYRMSELFINFMIYDIIRFCSESQFEKKLIEQFGNDQFKKIERLETPEQKHIYLRNLYCENLKDIAQAQFVMPFRINTPGQRRRPRYYLIHASKNYKALKVMKDEMYSISDSPYIFEAIGVKTPQLNLFDDPSKIDLEKNIINFCKNNCLKESKDYGEIERWAYINTTGVSKTIKKTLIKLENKSIIEIERKEGQQKNTVTAGAKILFHRNKKNE